MDSNDTRIDTEVLITLVEDRPVIWDKSLEIYKDKNLKLAAWREICGILKPNFDEIGEKERQVFGKLVTKKWSQTRDSWMKCIKKQKQLKTSGSSTKNYKVYTYHNQLSFLKKITEPAFTSDSMGMTENNEQLTEEKNINVEDLNTPNAPTPTTTARRKRTMNEVDVKLISFLDQQMKPKKEEPENRHLCFFKSILPSLSVLNEDQTLQFQCEILNLLRRIKNESQFLIQPPQHSGSSYQQDFTPTFLKPTGSSNFPDSLKNSPSTSVQTNISHWRTVSPNYTYINENTQFSQDSNTPRSSNISPSTETMEDEDSIDLTNL